MKLTKEQLKQIIKEELESTQQDFTIDEARHEPYETENFRRLSAYGSVGKKAQQMIRDLVADGDYLKLGKLADYASSMDLRKEIPGESWRGHNPFGFAMKNNPEPAELERTRRHFFSAFRDAHMNRPKAAPEAPPEEKPGFMDKIKGFFKEEQPIKLTNEQLMKIIKEELATVLEEEQMSIEQGIEKSATGDAHPSFYAAKMARTQGGDGKEIAKAIIKGLEEQGIDWKSAYQAKRMHGSMKEETAAKKIVDLMSEPMK